MGKKKNRLGASLIKNRNRKRKKNKSERHSEDDGEGRRFYGKINISGKKVSNTEKLQSILEQSHINEFMSSTFQNIQKPVVEKKYVYTENDDSSTPNPELFPYSKSEGYELDIPKRPEIKKGMSKKEYFSAEEKTFQEWRNKLLKIEKHYIVTPFEKNPKVWVELWRCVEKCNILFQIVDGRNPVLFRSSKLCDYIKEMSSIMGEKKEVIILINKSDLLTKKQRKKWCKYFNSKEIKFIFFSAYKSKMELIEKLNSNITLDNKKNKKVIQKQFNSIPVYDILKHRPYDILSRDNLVGYFKFLRKNFYSVEKKKNASKKFNIGMIGYPNVGKSSVINVITVIKRVAVAPTPGKTKYVQTMPIGKNIMLYDTPGLVFPSITTTKEEMYCNGILPIDRMQGDYLKPIKYIVKRIPKDVFELKYGIKIKGKGVYCSAKKFLKSFCKEKNLFTVGRMNVSVAVKILLKDFTEGVLLFCHPPPPKGDLGDESEEELDSSDEEEEEEEEEGEVEGEVDDDIDDIEMKGEDIESDGDDEMFEEEKDSVVIDLDDEEKDGEKDESVGKEKKLNEQKELERELKFNEENVMILSLLNRFERKQKGKKIKSKKKRGKVEREKHFVELDSGEKLKKSELKRREKNLIFKERKKKLKHLSKQEIRQLKRSKQYDSFVNK